MAGKTEKQLLKEEYGTASSISFASCTVHDSQGNILEPSKCKICGGYMVTAYGKESFKEFCMNSHCEAND